MKKLFLIFSTLCFINCTQKEDPISVSANTAVVEGVSTAIGGMADDQSGASFAKTDADLMSLLFPKAYAATCQRPSLAACSSGVKSETYSDCSVYSGTLDGDATLTYSDAACDMSTNGDTVTRTFDLTISGPRGGTLRVTSDSDTDYNGASYGGGGRITTTASGWDLEVLGRHQSLSFGGKELYSVSMRTLQPIEVTGSLGRTSRVVNGGQLEVNHNMVGFTAVAVPTNVQWTSSCCHPVSGSLSITYTGSKTGTSTVTFNGCGSAQVEQNGETESIDLSYCE